MHFALKPPFHHIVVCAIVVILANSLPISPLIPAQVAHSDTGASILRPSSPSTARSYRFQVDTVDPSAESNPKGATANGFRGEGQLILYTGNFGDRTGTNTAGVEATVIDGIITQNDTGNSAIPPNGFVISGHGAAAQWMQRFAKKGAQVAYEPEQRQIAIRFTPAVYLNQVDDALSRAKERPPAERERYQQHLTQAETCRARLASPEWQDITPEFVELAAQCEQAANRAFYNTSESRQGEFRGAWVRPNSLNPAQIQKSIDQMQRLHVKHIFLETYYQGETIYPSQVMSDYGLSPQHPQFKAGDPLQLWIDAAHQAGIKVHVWVQVFFAGNEKENIEQYGPILHKYPQWRNIERPYWDKPAPVASDVEPGHYFVDPANPEVRLFLEKLLLEMVNRYDVDGINLDYIRYPASAPVSSGSYLNTTWGYTESARNQFKALIAQERQAAELNRIDALKKAGKPIPKAPSKPPTPPSVDPKDLTPKSPLWPQWVTWRKNVVSTFVQQIEQKAHALKPNLLISAVIFPSSDSTYAQKLQDYPRWAKEGWIQALTPIGLSTIPEKMQRQAIQLQEQVQHKIPVHVGVFAVYNRQDPIDLIRQIDALHKADIPGIVLFDWSRLAPEYEEALKEGPFRQ